MRVLPTKKSEPVRTCVGCRRTCGSGELVRFHHDRSGRLATGHGGGRGAWLCRDTIGSCAEKAARSRAFDRALRSRVDPVELAQVVAEATISPGGPE